MERETWLESSWLEVLSLSREQCQPKGIAIPVKIQLPHFLFPYF